MNKHTTNNKERHKNNHLPIEQRSDKVCVNIIKELFADELSIVGDLLHDIIDYSTVDVHLDEGLILTFENVDDVIIKDIRTEFDKYNIQHHFDKKSKQLVIYK